jgi:hypothetical protein
MPANAGIQSKRRPRSGIERLVKVSPTWINALDQVELQSPLPFLELLFPSNRLVDIGVVLVPDPPAVGATRRPFCFDRSQTLAASASV